MRANHTLEPRARQEHGRPAVAVRTLKLHVRHSGIEPHGLGAHQDRPVGLQGEGDTDRVLKGLSSVSSDRRRIEPKSPTRLIRDDRMTPRIKHDPLAIGGLAPWHIFEIARVRNGRQQRKVHFREQV